MIIAVVPVIAAIIGIAVISVIIAVPVAVIVAMIISMTVSISGSAIAAIPIGRAPRIVMRIPGVVVSGVGIAP